MFSAKSLSLSLSLSLSSVCLFVCFLVVDFVRKNFEKKEAQKNFSEALNPKTLNAIFHASQRRQSVVPQIYWCRVPSLYKIIIIMSNNTNAMKRVERLKTHVVVSAPLLNNDTTNNNSFLERQETSFFSSPFGVRSFVY